MAKAAESCQPKAIAGIFTSLLPILQWLPRYNWKEDFICDLIAGVTVGIMVVPQGKGFRRTLDCLRNIPKLFRKLIHCFFSGMAYASLANVPAVVGLYANFVAIFIYMFFGTSRHISVGKLTFISFMFCFRSNIFQILTKLSSGTFAVASMMVGGAQDKYFPHRNTSLTLWEPQMTSFGVEISPIAFTNSLTFFVGIVQLIMGLLRLSFLTKYISDPLVSGFTTGAAAHVFMSQVPKAMGVSGGKYHGPGELVVKAWTCITNIPKINFYTLTIAVIGCCFLYFGREYLNPSFQKRFRIPIPLELILVIVADVLSVILGFEKNFKVDIVKRVPNG